MNEKPKRGRVQSKDLEESMFTPNPKVKGGIVDRNFREPLEREVICYTLFGKHDGLLDDMPILEDEADKDVFAKIVNVNHGHPKYLIKTDSNKRFFNPLGMKEGKQDKVGHRAGKKEYEFVKVGHRAFKFYLDFLRTKNVANLYNAEREAF